MSKSSKNKLNFAKSFKELEAIADWFESDNIDLDQALKKVERGLQLASQLKQHLETVENKVEHIKQKFQTSSAKAE